MNQIFQRHFCVTTYVIHPQNQKFLLVHHKKLNRWVPPGGHIDDGELPDSAALRETFEETGLKVRLISDGSPTSTCLAQPFGIQQNIIKADEHEHLDIIYFAVPITNPDCASMNSAESLGLGWFSANEIADESFSTFESVRDWTRYFISKFGGKNV